MMPTRKELEAKFNAILDPAKRAANLAAIKRQIATAKKPTKAEIDAWLAEAKKEADKGPKSLRDTLSHEAQTHQGPEAPAAVRTAFTAAMKAAKFPADVQEKLHATYPRLAFGDIRKITEHAAKCRDLCVAAKRPEFVPLALGIGMNIESLRSVLIEETRDTGPELSTHIGFDQRVDARTGKLTTTTKASSKFADGSRDVHEREVHAPRAPRYVPTP